MIGVSTRSIVVLLLMVIAGSTVFFHFVEGWDWLDSYFFTVVTLSTVGYGNLVPKTAIGMIGTTVVIMIGLGIFAVAIQRFGAFAVHHQEKRIRLHEEEAKRSKENKT